MKYIDPIPAVVRFLNDVMGVRVYGNSFPNMPTLPALLVRTTGGINYTRLQILARADDDISAMSICIRALNFLERNPSYLHGITLKYIQREQNPIHARDEDTGKPESWCYVLLHHLEA